MTYQDYERKYKMRTKLPKKIMNEKKQVIFTSKVEEVRGGKRWENDESDKNNQGW